MHAALFASILKITTMGHNSHKEGPTCWYNFPVLYQALTGSVNVVVDIDYPVRCRPVEGA